MKRLISFLALFLVVAFIAPAVAHIGVWQVRDRPSSWRDADWGSAGTLPTPERDAALVHVMSARTGGLKGALATHSWLLVKKPGAARYDRYDVVGWGRPVRKNAYAPDARWYSNEPHVVWSVEGAAAERLIAPIEASIASYPWSKPGDYNIWPGPNSNSFVAHVVHSVPGIATTLPAEAVGRDFPTDGGWLWRDSAGTLRGSLGGYAGFAVGRAVGLELNFIGLVTGFNPFAGEIKLPGFGTLRPFG